MPETYSSATDGRLTRTGSRAIVIGLAAIVAILAVTAFLLFRNLPDADAFNTAIERLILENTNLTSPAELRLIGILAQTGNTMSAVLVSYPTVIFVLLVFASALLITALVLVLALIALNRKLAQVQRAGIQVASLVISRAERKVYLNDMEFTLTAAAAETLAALAEARMDGEMLTGAELEAVVSGKRAIDCDEAAGATRIKRLRDSLGNQIVSEVLVRNVARQGYTLAIDKNVIRMV